MSVSTGIEVEPGKRILILNPIGISYEKLTATTTPEKNLYDKPFVQVEGELTEEQLEAIAGGQSDDTRASN